MTPVVEPLKTSEVVRPSTARVPRRFGLDALHVFVLTSFAIAENFYDRLAHQAEFLVDPEVTPLAIAGVVVVMSLLLPALIVGLEGLAGLRHRQLREALHLSVVLLCSTLLLLEIWQRATFLPGVFVIVGALGSACAVTAAYDRFAGLRSLVTWAAPALIVFPMILWMRLHATDASVAHRAIHDLSRDPVPVVMVVFDEFCGGSLMTPDREIDAVRFPHLAELRQHSTWYRGAASVSPDTIHALPAILTGNYTRNGYQLAPSTYPQNLFNMLSTAGGYDLAVFEPMTALAPRRSERHESGIREALSQTVGILNVLSHVYLYELTPNDFHSRLPIVPPVWFGFHDSDHVDRAARRGTFRYGWTDRRDEQVEHFLRCVDSTPRSVLYFAHLMIPHAPWCYFPTGTRYARDRSNLDKLCLESDSSIISDELGVIQNQQRHLLQVMYVDSLVGQLTARLKEVGVWERCLLIVTADHGISFRLGQGRRQYSQDNAADILSVPLFIKYPGHTSGEVNDLPVQSTDLLPTILDQVGIQPVIPMIGSPVRDPGIALRDKLVVHDPYNNLSFSPEVLLHSHVPDLIRTRFGDSSDRWNLFRIGPHSEWLGRPVKSFRIGTGQPRKLECLLPLPPVQATGAEQHPYHIEGRVLSPGILDKPIELLVTVHGVVCGTTRTYRQFGFTDRWSIMLPEWSYSSEVDHPGFYSIGEDGTLAPCHLDWVETLGQTPAKP